MASKPCVLITGASGLLGRAIMSEFAATGTWEVIGTALSRAGDGLRRVDLRNRDECRAVVAETRPAVVIHAAAERRPDVCEKDKAGSEVLNVESVWELGRACAALGDGTLFVQISTDYLFNGTGAPYTEEGRTDPLNEYGRLKLRGEHAALAATPRACILRIPVLYGPTPDLTESAVTTFAAAVRNRDKKQTIDDWQIRVPTYTPDIGRTLVNMSNVWIGRAPPYPTPAELVPPTAAAAPAAAADAVLPREALLGTFNYSSDERWTRYGLVQYYAGLLGLPHEHITGDPSPPSGAPRPYDCKLDCTKLRSLRLAAPSTPFDQACKQILGL